MQPPTGQTCGQYLNDYALRSGGSIYNPNATADCQYCAVSTADQFLASVAIMPSQRWRNYGIGFSYIVFNIFMAVVLYYVFRVRKSSGSSGGGLFKMFKKKGKEPERKKEEAEKREEGRVGGGEVAERKETVV